MAQGSIKESRCYLIVAKDLEYGDISELSQPLEEVSKLLEAYSQAILNSDFPGPTSFPVGEETDAGAG